MYIHNMLQMMNILEPKRGNTFEEPKSKLYGFIFLKVMFTSSHTIYCAWHVQLELYFGTYF